MIKIITIPFRGATDQRTYLKTNKQNMENQNTLNYATLTLAIDDLKLLQDALNALELQRIGLGCNVKDEINRLHHAISLVIYNDVATANSQSASMNS